MIKYVLVGFSNPNLGKGTADLTVLCQKQGCMYWEATAKNNRDNWLKFETREEAEKHAKNFTNVITYGIQVK